MPNVMKVSAEGWVDAAREALIKDGPAGVRINRLAKSLGVTRGGFYYHFKSQDDLLELLLKSWREQNIFLPATGEMSSPQDAVSYIENVAANLILEERFSPSFEQAIREWARVDAKVAATVEKVDAERMDQLTEVFSVLGCEPSEAKIRARVFYFHQMGFYSLGFHNKQTREQRMVNFPVYLRILCGKRFLEAAGEAARKWL